MSKWCARSIFVTAVLVMSRTENAIGGTMKSGIHKTERSNFENGMFGILDFFGSSSDDSKPEFITTFDLMRLSNAEYAMKQFHCLLNENPCDSVGLRLKASIPEEINTDCKRCTSTETFNIRRIVTYVKNHYPESWQRIEPLYRNKK